MFSTYHKYGLTVAERVLDAKADVIGRCGSVGLKAELQFYHANKDSMQLVPTLDCGDKTDFVGSYRNRFVRIDVTTNVNYKHITDFDKPIENHNALYRVAVVNPATGKLEEFIDMNLPISSDGSRMFSAAIMHGPDCNSDGCSRYNPWQEIVTIDTELRTIDFGNNIIQTDWHIDTFGQMLCNEIEACNGDDVDDCFDEASLKEYYGSDVARFLSKIYNRNILCCIEQKYIYNNFTDEGEYVDIVQWAHPLLKEFEISVGDEISAEF